MVGSPLAWPHGEFVDSPSGDTDVEAIDISRSVGRRYRRHFRTLCGSKLTPEELLELAPRLGFHPQAVEDAVKAADGLGETAQRTKMNRFGSHVFLYLFSTSLDPSAGQLSLTEIPAFVSPKYVVVVDRSQPVLRRVCWPAGAKTRHSCNTASPHCCTACSTSSLTHTFAPWTR